MLYKINQSPFYQLKTKAKLAGLLNFRLDRLDIILNSDNNYNCFTIKKAGCKNREIQEPIKELNSIHARILDLLSRIQTPEYLHSAVKRRSYISNALAHRDSIKLVKLDIRSFYPSTKSHHVYGFFFHQMRCSSDVSAILAKLCTINGVLPTGSPVSPLLAFFSHITMFDQLADLAKSNNLIFTAYVDDLAFSGESFPAGFSWKVERIVKNRGLAINDKKTKTYSEDAPKKVTGVILTKGMVRLPNYRSKMIKNLLDQLRIANTDQDKLSILQKAIGRTCEAAQIENKYRHLSKKLIEIQRDIKFKLLNTNLKTV